MKMQLRKILILPAVDDQAICGEMEFLHKALDGGIQISEKGCICRINSFNEATAFFGTSNTWNGYDGFG